MRYFLFVFLVLSLFVPAAMAAPAEDGLIAHWKLDEGTGLTVLDSSGNGYNGLLGGGASWSTDRPPVPGAGAYAVYLNGTGYIDTAAFDIENNFTIAAWIKPDDGFGRHNILGKHTADGQNQFLFGLYEDTYALNIRDSLEQLSIVRDSEWYHVLLVGRGGSAGTTVDMYHNGVPQWTYKLDKAMGDVSGGKPWTIGRDWDPAEANDYFVGLVSDVRIYDHALDDEEIAALTDGFAVTCDASDPLYRAIDNAYDSCDIISLGPYEHDLVFEGSPSRGLIFEGAGREESTLLVEDTAMRFLNLGRHTTLRNLTVRRNNYKLGSGGKGGFLNIKPRVEVTLEDVGFKNGYAWYDGGAIHNEGILSIQDGLFEENKGAAYLHVSDHYKGGAINNEGVLILNDTVFSGNFTFGDGNSGGTIANSGNLVATNIAISDSNGDNGGAIYNTGAAVLTGAVLQNNEGGGGGGVYNAGSLILKDSSLDGNKTYPFEGGTLPYLHAGGALYNSETGSAAVTNSDLLNSSGSFGGALFNRGTLNVSRSLISGSTAADGGAIMNRGNLTVGESTISDNHADQYAGAIYNLKASEVTIAGSTISGNSVARTTMSAAAIFNQGSITARNSTITGNFIPNPTGGTSVRPAIFQNSPDTTAVLQLIHTTLAGNGVSEAEFERGIVVDLGTVVLKNALLAENGAANCQPAGQGVITATAGTLSDDSSCDGAVMADNLALQPLADNGGQTWTMAIGADSDARDAGLTADCEEFDQRRVPRDDGACDAGAYEYTEEIINDGNRVLLPLVRGQ
ncbi:MAG: LamG-like jellyroll fold domain-containing protein [Candidatus Promineifilaceae bacterium]